MKSVTIPLICGLLLASMIAAGASHWWSVQKLTGLLANGVDIPSTTAASPSHDRAPDDDPAIVAATAPASPAPVAAAAITAFSNADEASQTQFYEALIQKLSRVETQNRDLLDQLAETNRDLMMLGFRVDTHAESFRPLPADEGRSFDIMEPNPGVLPPRSTPKGLQRYE